MHPLRVRFHAFIECAAEVDFIKQAFIFRMRNVSAIIGSGSRLLYAWIFRKQRTTAYLLLIGLTWTHLVWLKAAFFQSQLPSRWGCYYIPALRSIGVMPVPVLLTARRGSITLVSIASIAIIEADRFLLSCLLQYSQALNYRLSSLPPEIRQHIERLYDTLEQEQGIYICRHYERALSLIRDGHERTTDLTMPRC